MIPFALLLALQDVQSLIARLDQEPAVAEQILEAGEAARGPLKAAGKTRLLAQLELALAHASFEKFAHRLWFGAEADALALLEEVGGLAERGGKFGPSGAKNFLRPPALHPVLKEFLARFKQGPVTRTAARLVLVHRLDDFEGDLLALSPGTDAALQSTIVEALGFIGTLRAEAVMVPRLKDAAGSTTLDAAHRWARRTLAESAGPVLDECIRKGPEANAIAALETIVRFGRPAPAVAAIDSPSKRVRRAALKAVAAMRVPEAIPRLIRAIEDEDSDCRMTAIEALVGLRARESAPAMAAALQRNQPPAIRAALAAALLEVDPEGRIETVAPLLREPAASLRRGILISLGRIRAPRATALLVEALSDADPWNRQLAAQGLVQRDTPDVRAALVRALDDAEPDVQESALRALESIGGPDAVPKIIERLDTASESVRDRAGRALLACVTGEHLDRVRQAYASNPHADARAWLFSALLRAGEKLDDEALRAALESDSAGVRAQALDLAYRRRSGLVEGRLTDPDPNLRRQAARALALMGRRDLIPSFAAMLADPAPKARLGGVEALDYLQARDRREAIERLLEDRDEEVRGRARAAVVSLGGSVPTRSAEELLTSGSPDDKLNVMAAIRRTRSNAMLELVRRATADRDPFVRRSALATLAALQDFQGVDLIAARLRDDDVSVRAAALRALPSVDPALAERHAVANLDHASEIVRQAAIEAIGELAPDRAQPNLVKCLNIPALRAQALEALGRLGGEKNVALVERYASDRSSGVREAAIQALAAMEARRCAATIGRALQDPQASVRAVAATALAQLEAKDQLPAIRELLKDTAGDVLGAAAQAVHRLKDREAPPLLRPLLEHADERVSQAAALALLDLGGEEEIPAVLATLQRTAPVWQVRLLARLATTESPDLPPVLERLIRDPDNSQRFELIRLCGAAALQEMEPALAALLDDASLVVRAAALEALARLVASPATCERLAAGDEDALLRTRAAAALAAAGDRRAVGLLRGRLGRASDYRRVVPTGGTLSREEPIVLDGSDVRAAERDAMVALNRLRRRAAWLALETRTVEPAARSPAELFPDFTTTLPEGWEEVQIPLDAPAPARRTSLRALWLLPGAPVVEAQELRILDSDDAIRFWSEWLDAQP
jgi:HEAT repeat protein